jgi:hypothetical protein
MEVQHQLDHLLLGYLFYAILDEHYLGLSGWFRP